MVCEKEIKGDWALVGMISLGTRFGINIGRFEYIFIPSVCSELIFGVFTQFCCLQGASNLNACVHVQGGFVWLFYGSRQMPEDERPPIPMVPELEDPNWKAVYGDITFDCNHWSVFENAIDMAHIHYLHNDSFGNKDMPQIREMTCKAEAFHVNGDFVLHNKPVNALWEFSKVISYPLSP